MKWALSNNERIEATPNSKALCPVCNNEVISKCGTIKIWHWSHLSNKDCDNWYEPESEWHRNWKNLFPKEQQEVITKKENKYHIADIKTKNGLVIELQNSSISSEDIEKREKFYENMIWVLNSSELGNGLNFRQKNNIITFRWKHPPKSWWYATKPIYLDLGKGIFKIRKIYKNIPCGGWGEFISLNDFLEEYD